MKEQARQPNSKSLSQRARTVFSPEDIDIFRKLMAKECGEQLSPQEAWDRATELLALYRVILGPIPEDPEAGESVQTSSDLP